VDGLELLYRVIAGPDSRDSTSRETPEPLDDARAGAQGLRVGFAATLLDRPGVEPAVSRAVRETAQSLERGGATLCEVELPDPDTAVATYYLLATAEASSNLARYDGVRYGVRVPGEGLEAMIRRTRHAGFGPEVKRRILLGTYVLSAGYYDAYYLRAQKHRMRLRRTLLSLFEAVDLVLLPTSPTVAFRLGERVLDPMSMYLADVFTVYANLAGLPALSLPGGRDAQGLPVGVQLLASPWREDRLFRAARALRGADGGAWPAQEAGR
jgi:aspartyl-tRNA(Asn)/glutamyl-tRNA(Gln) amidotransferase subunit A